MFINLHWLYIHLCDYFEWCPLPSKIVSYPLWRHRSCLLDSHYLQQLIEKELNKTTVEWVSELQFLIHGFAQTSSFVAFTLVILSSHLSRAFLLQQFVITQEETLPLQVGALCGNPFFQILFARTRNPTNVYRFRLSPFSWICFQYPGVLRSYWSVITCYRL